MTDLLMRVEDLYLREYQKMWRAIFAFSNSSEVANESVAEAFTQVIRRGSEIKDMRAWVWKAVYRIASGILSNRNLKSSFESELDEVKHRSVNHFFNDSAHVEFLGLLSGLSEQQRIIIVLRYVAGMKPKEIAGVIDSTSESVRVPLNRAHKSLKGSLSLERSK